MLYRLALMTAALIDGKAVAARVREDVAREVSELALQTGRTPGLATVLVGDDPASAVYIASKRRACAEVGIADLHRHLASGVPEAHVTALLDELNGDPQVSGILLQLPVPDYMDGAAVTARISPEKDVDGLTPISATVTCCHSRTRDLAGVCARADVLVAAVGVPGLIGSEHIKEGAVVIDVGLIRTEEGLRGDVNFQAASERARLITPVPGGVGPMTVAMLLRNTLAAFRLQALSLAPATR